jgi:putative two-component system response regulator
VRTLVQDKPTVLIVDDQLASRKMLADVLMSEGYAVVEAENGEQALAIVPSVNPDLILLDVVMPGINGFEVCRQLKSDEQTRLIPVIFITSLDDKEARLKGIEASGDEFLTRPIDPMELSARVKSLVRQHQLNQDLDHAEQVLFSIARAVESRDPNTGDHCERLVHRGEAFGKFLGLARSEVRDLMWAGYLHDIGKLGISDAILLKPGKFIPEEFEVMKQHVLIGENICKPLRTMRGVLPIIRHHHERWDGTGYPDKLAKHEIPYLAQVFQVIDIYDALVSERPYKKGMSATEALDVLQDEAQRGWRNPELTRQFMDFIYATELKSDNRPIWFERYLKRPAPDKVIEKIVV